MNNKEFIEVIRQRKAMEKYIEARALQKYQILNRTFDRGWELGYIEFDDEYNPTECSVQWYDMDCESCNGDNISITMFELRMDANEWEEYLSSLKEREEEKKRIQEERWAQKEHDIKMKEYLQLKKELFDE
jgi:hypothetical protein